VGTSGMVGTDSLATKLWSMVGHAMLAAAVVGMLVERACSDGHVESGAKIAKIAGGAMSTIAAERSRHLLTLPLERRSVPAIVDCLPPLPPGAAVAFVRCPCRCWKMPMIVKLHLAGVRAKAKRPVHHDIIASFPLQ